MQKCFLYVELIHNVTRRKNVSVICKDLVSWVKETSLTKEVAFPKKVAFPLLIISDENNIGKLVADMWGNCFNRLCQLLYN